MSQEKKPYLIDAIIGNSRLLASLGRNGRLYRLWWPHIDYPQHVDEIRTGIKLAGKMEQTSWFDDAQDGWSFEAAYVPRTNIFTVQASSDRFGLDIASAHFAVPGENTLVRTYSFTNRGMEPISFQLLHYTSFMPMENQLYNAAYFDETTDALVHYRHAYCFAVSSGMPCTGYQVGGAWQDAQVGQLEGREVDTAPDGALSWEIRDLAAGETVQIPVLICAGQDRTAVLQQLQAAKAASPETWRLQTEAYWHEFLAHAVPCPLEGAEVRELYERSLLAMKLMTDEQSGAIVAAPEFDETFSRCGGYSFCWGRDAAFITTALDQAGLTDLSERFYDWALTAQEPDGSWQQRHYHDGRLAPSWGLQIDEGASLIWGMWQHYQLTSDLNFLHRIWPAAASGADFLARFIDPDTGLPRQSMDLWEERLAEHTYSAATVCAGLAAAAAIAEILGEEAHAKRWKHTAERVKISIERHCWNDKDEVFYRGLKLKVTEEQYHEAIAQNLPVSTSRNAKGYIQYRLDFDPMIDISLLGLSVPFSVIPADDPRMVRMAEVIEQRLTVPGVGGIKRYENDSYAGGNPWILTTLWLAQYRILCGQLDEAMNLLEWAIRHRTDMGLLPEQVDKETGNTAWVVPLTWSHAMFILTVHMLAQKEPHSSL